MDPIRNLQNPATRNLIRVASLALLAALLAACAGGPAITDRRVPDWVLEPPESTGEFEVFVASASAPGAAEAEQAAGLELLGQINQALGVEITVETSAQARSSLTDYEVDLIQQVTQSGSGRIDGLRIADRYIGEQADGIVVYLLGEYERGAFEAERRKRRSIVAQQEELLTGPEAAGDRLVSEGKISQGLLQYGQAAAAAAVSDSRIAPVVLERSLQKAADVASRLELTVESAPGQGSFGEALERPFVFVLRDDSGSPVTGAAIEISYTERRASRDIVRTAILFTDSDGKVAFEHPIPDHVGQARVTARLDIQPLLSVLDDLPARVRTRSDAMLDAVAGVRAVATFEILSRARLFPTAVAIVDLDAAGVPMTDGIAAAGLVEVLSAAGFQIFPASIPPAEIPGAAPRELIGIARQVVDPSVERLAFGLAQIVETREDDGFFVKVSGSVTVVEMSTGRILYQTSGIKNARSRSVSRALQTALSELGRQLGEELAANLP